MLPDGQIDTSFDPGSGADLFVNKVYSYTQTDLNVTSTVGTNVTITNLVTPNTGQHGKILIGGGFSSFNGVSRNGIARLNTNGTLDVTFNPGFGVNPGNAPASAVQDLAVQPDGKVMIVGNFTTVDNRAITRVARLNADGSYDTTFDSLGTGPNARVYAVDLILSTVTNITTNIDTTVTPNLQVVTHTLTHNVNKIVIAGDFTAVNGVPRNRVAVLNPDGTVDTTSFDSFGSGADSTVYDVLVQQDALRTDTRIVIAGTFKTINFNNRQGVARLNRNGSLDSTFNPGSGTDDSVFTIAADPSTDPFNPKIVPGGSLYLGGVFESYNVPVVSALPGCLEMAGWTPASWTTRSITLPD